MRLRAVRDGAGASQTVRETVREGDHFRFGPRSRRRPAHAPAPEHATVNVVPARVDHPTNSGRRSRSASSCPEELCTTPEETAELLHRAIMDAVAELRCETASRMTQNDEHCDRTGALLPRVSWYV
jgi:hypothetical protein